MDTAVSLMGLVWLLSVWTNSGHYDDSLALSAPLHTTLDTRRCLVYSRPRVCHHYRHNIWEIASPISPLRDWGEIKSRFVTTLMQARLEVEGQLLQPELDLGRYSDNSYIFYLIW